MFSSISKISRPALAIYAMLIGITATSVIYTSTPTHVVIQYMAIFMSMALVLVLQACGETTRTLKEKWFARKSFGDAAIAAICGWYVSAMAALVVLMVVSFI